MATTNFLQWNPTKANQESDSAFAADSQRTGGAVNPSNFDATLANKLFYQSSTFITAFCQALANKGISTSDADVNALAAVFAVFITSTNGLAITNSSYDGGSIGATTPMPASVSTLEVGGPAAVGVRLYGNGTTFVQRALAIADQTASRYLSTVYQNTTSAEMIVRVTLTAHLGGPNTAGTGTATIGPTSPPSLVVGQESVYQLSAPASGKLDFTVPAGQFYQVSIDVNLSIGKWIEETWS